MWATLKAIPLVPKILIGCLALGVAYKVSAPSHHRYAESHYSPVGYQGQSDGEGTSSGAGDVSARALAQFRAQQSQLMARVYQCEAQMNQATQQMAQAAANGVMVDNRPACEQYMPQWTAQEAYLETEIYRIQTGDRRSSVREITGVTGPTSSSSSSSGRSSSDGTDAVDNWDREAIRGNSLYTDENGEEHELPTRSYYFRDRVSGQIVGSDQPYAPNDGRDYEQLSYRPQQ